MEWIRVEDKLPEFVSLVLIWTTISTQPTLGYYVNQWMYLSVNGNFWLRDEPHIIVTHWMPLPNPPQDILDKINEKILF